MTAAPTILLCVGATKAGTTWLFDHLSAHEDCHLRTIKELHYFDTLENRAFGRQIAVQQAFADKLAQRAAVVKPALAGQVAQKRRDVAEWLAILQQRAENIPAYLAYLAEGRGAKRLVADITPAYAVLPEGRLRAMARMAGDVRFVYLMRDPVARLWSHVRMLAQRASATADAVPDAAFALLERVLAGGESAAVTRGDYAGALTRLGAAVDPRRLLVMFQEDMMTPPGLARLSAFLGIRPAGADFGKRVHEGRPLALPAAQVAQARAFLKPQYEFVARHYPVLPEAWRRNMGEGLQ